MGQQTNGLTGPVSPKNIDEQVKCSPPSKSKTGTAERPASAFVETEERSRRAVLLHASSL